MYKSRKLIAIFILTMNIVSGCASNESIAPIQSQVDEMKAQITALEKQVTALEKQNKEISSELNTVVTERIPEIGDILLKQSEVNQTTSKYLDFLGTNLGKLIDSVDQ